MSHSVREVLKYMDRARVGKRITPHDWDYKVIPQTLKEISKKYRLEKTCDTKNPVPTDPELADTFFKAGIEAALRLGLYNEDTETVIEVTEQELMAAVETAPAMLSIGSGLDKRIIAARRPEDPTPPMFGGPLSIQMNEEYYLPLMETTLKCKLVDIHEGPSLDTIYGSPLLANTPYETAAAFYEAHLREEAQYRAGRMGMGNMLISSSSTEYGNLAGFGLYKQPQIALVLIPSSLKTNYCSLHKVIQTLSLGGYVESGSPNMIGSYTGGPETSAIASVADELLQFTVHQAHQCASPIYDMRYSGNCGRHALWAQSISTQAMARNTHAIMLHTINQVAGPCTEMFYQETIVGFAAAAASGLPYTIGPRSAGGKYKNYMTPLDIWFAAMCFKGGAALSLEQANEVAKELIPKYEHLHANPPIGRSLPELYDMKTMQPIEEHLSLYLRMREEAIRLGLKMPSDGLYC